MFHEPVKNCEGCQIDDPNQKVKWEILVDVVEEYWGPIKSTTTLPETLKLAENVAGEVRTI